MNKMKKLLSLAMILVLALSLVSCGAGKMTGEYDLTKITDSNGADITWAVSLGSMMGYKYRLILNSDGNGTLLLGPDTFDIRWDQKSFKIDGETVPIRTGNNTVTFTIDYEGETETYIFTRNAGR